VVLVLKESRLYKKSFLVMLATTFTIEAQLCGADFSADPIDRLVQFHVAHCKLVSRPLDSESFVSLDFFANSLVLGQNKPAPATVIMRNQSTSDESNIFANPAELAIDRDKSAFGVYFTMTTFGTMRTGKFLGKLTGKPEFEGVLRTELGQEKYRCVLKLKNKI